MDHHQLEKIYILALLLLSTAFHEMGHAYVATWLGDATPGRNGRLTWNPFAHLQPVITAIILPVFMFMTSDSIMMLAMTPVSPNKFKHPLRDQALVAVAGPIMNLVCAAVMLGVLWIPGVWTYPPTLTSSALAWAAFYDILFAIFNMFPIPPLDGYRIARSILPLQIRMQTDSWAANPICLVIVFIFGGYLLGLIEPPLFKLYLHLLPD